MGVEEELALVDPRTRLAAPRSDRVVGEHDDRVGDSPRAIDDLAQERLLTRGVFAWEAMAQKRDNRRIIGGAKLTQCGASRRVSSLGAQHERPARRRKLM